MANDFRPLKSIGTRMSNWARRGDVQTTVRYSGRIRTAVDNIGIALGWMSRGYQYDSRTLRQRLTNESSIWHLRAAVRVLFWRKSRLV